jgi:hypothetical protein
MYLNSAVAEKLQGTEWLISARALGFSQLRSKAPRTWDITLSGLMAAVVLHLQLREISWQPQLASRKIPDTQTNELVSFDEAMQKLSREERFRATVYSMNTLLVQKGIFSPEEFEFQFRQFAQKTLT